MISIDKNHLTFLNFMDSAEVERAVKVAGTILNEDWILAYDTNDTIVYHSKSEIKKAMTRLPKYYIDTFNKDYDINQDIHDIIESGLMEKITLEVMKEVCPHSQPNKYFISFQDYLEMVFISNYYTVEEVA